MLFRHQSDVASKIAVKRGVPIGDVGIEREAWFNAVAQIDAAGVSAAAAHRIVLAVRGRGRAAAPVRSER